jgi:aminoglycoside 3-N-acetyltransferase
MMAGMAERALIEQSDAPRTRASIASDLRSLGVTPGGALLVHTAVSRLGWVCGGPVAVAQALLDALGPDGTLVVPTHTTGNSNPARWENPPVPAAWWPLIREHMPGFDPQITPSQGVGALPEVVRTLPGAFRSAHPQMSFAAIGPQAERITAGHVLESGLGEGSPLAIVERGPP